MEIKILEWNINQRLNYSGRNIPMWVAEVIKEESADITALTEVYKGNNWEDIKREAFNSNYAIYETSNHSVRQNDVAVAINTNKLDVIYEKSFPSNPDNDIPDYLEVKLKTKDTNIEFIFICMRIHTSVEDDVRRKELEFALKNNIEVEKIIICGDFNNYRRGCPKRIWNMDSFNKLCEENQFFSKIPEGSSIYEEKLNDIENQFPEDRFILKGIKPEQFELMPYNRDFVKKDRAIYKWGKDFKKYFGKDKNGKSICDVVPPPYPDHALLEGILYI